MHNHIYLPWYKATNNPLSNAIKMVCIRLETLYHSNKSRPFFAHLRFSFRPFTVHHVFMTIMEFFEWDDGGAWGDEVVDEAIPEEMAQIAIVVPRRPAPSTDREGVLKHPLVLALMIGTLIGASMWLGAKYLSETLNHAIEVVTSNKMEIMTNNQN